MERTQARTYRSSAQITKTTMVAAMMNLRRLPLQADVLSGRAFVQLGMFVQSLKRPRSNLRSHFVNS